MTRKFTHLYQRTSNAQVAIGNILYSKIPGLVVNNLPYCCSHYRFHVVACLPQCDLLHPFDLPQGYQK